MSFEAVVSCCRDLLINFPDAKDVADYADKRLSRAGQEKFSFGYFPAHKNLQALIAMVGEEKLSKLELIYDRIVQDGVSNRKITRSSMENHNLVMPYKDVYGNVIGLVGRTILNDEQRNKANIPKYKNTSRDTGLVKGSHLFGLFESKDSIIKNNLAFIVEGQFDCITSYDKGLTNVVAAGTSNMTFEQFALITRYTNNIVLLFDNDDAGKTGSDKIIKLYSKYANIKRAELPKGFKDIDEYLSENSIEDLNFILK
jgi:DNA primase